MNMSYLYLLLLFFWVQDTHHHDVKNGDASREVVYHHALSDVNCVTHDAIVWSYVLIHSEVNDVANVVKVRDVMVCDAMDYVLNRVVWSHGVANNVLDCDMNLHAVANDVKIRDVMVCYTMNDVLNLVVWCHDVANDVLDCDMNFHAVANDVKIRELMVYDAMDYVKNLQIYDMKVPDVQVHDLRVHDVTAAHHVIDHDLNSFVDFVVDGAQILEIDFPCGVEFHIDMTRTLVRLIYPRESNDKTFHGGEVSK